jgi:hypothetical protein
MQVATNMYEIGQKRKTERIPDTYLEASYMGLDYFKNYVQENSPKLIKNKSRLENIEKVLFHSYGDKIMYMNEAVFVILILNGYQFDNNLFALLVLGSICDLFGLDYIEQNGELFHLFEYYKNLEINIKDEKDLMCKMQSFVHYMYDNESHNQELYMNELVGLPATIRSFKFCNRELIFSNFKCYI